MFIVFLELKIMAYNEQAIKEAAYYIWQNAGCPNGQDEYFWSMAVEQLSKKCSKTSCAKKSSSSKSSCAKKSSSTAKKSTTKKSK
jgi:hypothetical protein